MNLRPHLSHIALVIGAVLLSIGLQASAAFTQPSAAPPNADAYAPLTTSPDAQAKVGGLLLNTGGAANGLIVQSGNVGIGTTDPTYMLTVGNSTAATSILGGLGLDAYKFHYFTTNGVPVIYSTASIGNEYPFLSTGNLVIQGKSSDSTGGDIVVATDQTTRMVVNRAGNVGIGTTNPGGNLDVRGVTVFGPAGLNYDVMAIVPGTAAVGQMTTLETYNGNGLKLVTYNTNSNTYNAGLNIDMLGNVGIGTVSPLSTVDVFGAYQNGGGQLRLSSNGPNTYGELIFSSNNAYFKDDGASIEGTGFGVGVDVGGLIFKTEWASVRQPRMTISSNGYVTFNQGHNDLAENYVVAGKVLRGSVVSIDQTQSKTAVASDPSHQSILGIVSTAPGAVMDENGGFMIGSATKEHYENEKAPVALQGTAPTLVTSENGPIAIGDAIGVSTIPGFGSKMVTTGTMVGRALEKLDASSACQAASSIESIVWPNDDGKNSLKPCFSLPDGTIIGKIMVAVNVSWYDPTTFMEKIWAEISSIKDAILDHGNRITQLEKENADLEARVSALEKR